MLTISMTSQASQRCQSTSDAGRSTTAHSMTSTPATGVPRSVTSRPKLTLQTTSLPRTFGSSTTGLSLAFATGAGVSPTVRNTFKNAYDVAVPSSATASPSKSSNRVFKISSPYAISNNNGPYQLSRGVRSILRNSPLEPSPRRRSVSITANGTNGGSGARRVFFPAKKQVSYRYPLEEEIKTVRFTAKHSDLMVEPKFQDLGDSASDEDSDTNSSSSQSDSNTSDDDVGNLNPLTKLERKKRKHLGSERQVRAAALLDGLNTDSLGCTTPQTPRQGRAKRRREWKWTLGSFEASNEIGRLPATPDDAKSNFRFDAPQSQISQHDVQPEDHTISRSADPALADLSQDHPSSTIPPIEQKSETSDGGSECPQEPLVLTTSQPDSLRTMSYRRQASDGVDETSGGSIESIPHPAMAGRPSFLVLLPLIIFIFSHLNFITSSVHILSFLVVARFLLPLLAFFLYPCPYLVACTT